jgi:hypothetical protein
LIWGASAPFEHTTMAYSTNTILAVKDAPKNLGNTLGRLAVQIDFSVVRLSKATGATRQTVYNWFMGGEVLGAYKPRVERVVEILRAARTADTAWAQICKEFNLQA